MHQNKYTTFPNQINNLFITYAKQLQKKHINFDIYTLWRINQD